MKIKTLVSLFSVVALLCFAPAFAHANDKACEKTLSKVVQKANVENGLKKLIGRYRHLEGDSDFGNEITISLSEKRLIVSGYLPEMVV
ncbi:MAG: hypothetical protein AB1540_10845, partial [Bdellovibrionota bacterium]